MKLCLLILIHFISDFLLQSREMGKNKSSNYYWLSAHISIIFLAFLPFGIKFTLINALLHGVIDKNIWKLYKLSAYNRIARNSAHPLLRTTSDKPEWQYWDDHWFYATIGLDQLLHTLTLIVLAGWGI